MTFSFPTFRAVLCCFWVPVLSVNHFVSKRFQKWKYSEFLLIFRIFIPSGIWIWVIVGLSYFALTDGLERSVFFLFSSIYCVGETVLSHFRATFLKQVLFKNEVKRDFADLLLIGSNFIMSLKAWINLLKPNSIKLCRVNFKFGWLKNWKCIFHNIFLISLQGST